MSSVIERNGTAASAMQSNLRVAIVVSHPIQHFVHLYRGLAAQPGLQVKVFFASRMGTKPYFDRDMAVEIQWHTDLLGGYDYQFLPEADAIGSASFWSVNNPSIVAALKAFAPDVVQLHGYAQLTLLRALLWCRLKRVPALLWSDSSLLFERTGWKKNLKKVVLPLLLRQFAGVLSTGDNNAAYYRHYGVKPERLFRCPFTVDEALLGQARDTRRETRKVMRERYGIADDTFVLLFVGKLAPWKRPGDILAALQQLRARLPNQANYLAFFAGDGVLKTQLQANAAINGLPARFAGFVNVDVLPSIYAIADVLVFPSDREPYGLSAREAICVGLPLIVSDQIGCVGETDAARPGRNAWVYPAGDVAALSEVILALMKDAARCSNMSAESLSIAREIGPERSIRGFVEAAATVSSRPVVVVPSLPDIDQKC